MLPNWLKEELPKNVWKLEFWIQIFGLCQSGIIMPNKIGESYFRITKGRPSIKVMLSPQKSITSDESYSKKQIFDICKHHKKSKNILLKIGGSYDSTTESRPSIKVMLPF